MFRILAFVAVFACLATAEIAGSDPEEESTSSPAPVEANGFRFDASYVVDWSQIATGRHRRSEAVLGLLDLRLELDLEALFGLKGGTFASDYYMKRGRSVSEDVGDIQGISNMDGIDFRQLHELWYQQWLFDDFLRIKVGKVDANSEFAFVNSAEELINSSAGVSPTVLHMPTYANSATSINVFSYPTSWMYAGVGYYDVPATICAPQDPMHSMAEMKRRNGKYWIGEIGFAWRNEKLGSGHLAVGPWYHFGYLDASEVATMSSSVGFYAVFEQQLWEQRAASRGGERDLKLFLQLGSADDSVSEFANHASFGLISTGLLPGRDEDVAGFMMSFVDLSDEHRLHFERNETTLEAFYHLQITQFLGITSDIQYVIHPSGSPALANALVATARIEVGFGLGDQD